MICKLICHKKDPCLYVLRYANNLEFGEKTHEVTMTALRLVQRMKKDNIHYGRRPSGLCGAALLVAARLHDFSRTVTDIVRIVHIHESTLRKRLVEFGETPSSSLTLDEFMNVDLEEEQDPPSYKAARAKDREKAERLQKMLDEIDSGTQLTGLQKEIESQLEERRALKRVPSDLIPTIVQPTTDKPTENDEKLRTEEAEEEDTCRFLAQATAAVVEEYFSSGPMETETVEPVGLGPTDALMGLDGKREAVQRTESMFDDESGDLNLDGIDDDEIDQYLMSAEDAKNKDTIWMSLNATYLKEQKEKEEKLAKEREEGKPEKKKRKTGRKNKQTAAFSAGEAIEKMLQEKKISSKINYDVLKSLNADGTVDISQEPPVQQEPEIILPPPKSAQSLKRAKTPKLQKERVKIEMKTEPMKVKEKLKTELADVKTDQATTSGDVTEAEAEAEMEMEEYEEEEVEAEHTMSLSQMLNRHRADDNYYGYDDEDY